MAGGRRPTIATVALVLVLAVAAAAGGFGAARSWRDGRTEAAATATVTVGPTPAAVVSATDPPPTDPAPPGGPPARAAAVARAVTPLLGSPALGGSVHALVVDASSGAALLRRGPGVSLPPASTTKLLTATALLAVVGAEHRIATRVVAGRRAGQIVLIGAGDPTLSAAAPKQPTLYPGAGRISDLAAQVGAATSRKITSIVVDSTLFTGAPVAPGWQPEDAPSDYASAITATVVDGGRPATGGNRRSSEPDLEAGRALARRLGLTHVGVTRGRAPVAARDLATVRSPTVLDMIEQMLFTSDNVMAEMLARQVALAQHRPLSFAGAVAAIRTALASVGVAVPRTLADASGLSQDDRLTPALLVALLRTALIGRHPALAQLVSALPVAGWEGTLASRYQVPASVDAAGRVRAKTGTLTGVVTLAGAVRDRSGRLLIFAIMADQVPATGPVAAESAVDAAVARLAECGCR